MTTTAKDRALRLLGVRARSREELRRRLQQKGHDAEEVASALDDLEAVGLVDDEAFARQVVEHGVTSRGSGGREILSKLRQAGVDRGLAESVLAEVGGEDESVRAEEVARARVTRLGGLDDRAAYRRLLGYLQRRGYDGETSREAARKALDAARTL